MFRHAPCGLDMMRVENGPSIGLKPSEGIFETVAHAMLVSLVGRVQTIETRTEKSVAARHGGAGASARRLARRRTGAALACLLALILLLSLASWGVSHLPLSSGWRPASLLWPWTFIAVAFAALWACRKAGINFVIRGAMRAHRGADAEVDVGRMLDGLPQGYHAVHDLIFDGFNIDHVVVGPTGVFVIDTKSHAGTVSACEDELFLNGRPFEKPVVKQVWAEAYTVRDLLKAGGSTVPVQPLLCFFNAFVTVRAPVQGVIITSRHFVERALTRSPSGRLLSETEVRGVLSAVSRKTTAAIPSSPRVAPPFVLGRPGG
jgi:hypothetical protein